MEKTRQWAILTVVVVLVVLAGGWFMLVSPQRSKASDVRDQVTTAQQNNTQLKNELASLKAERKDLPKVQAQLAKLASQLPSNPGLPSLVRELSAAADSAGVDLVSLSPSTPTFVVSAAAATTLTPAAPAPSASPGTDSSSSTSTTDTSGAATTPVTPTAPAATYGQLAQVPLTVVVNGSYFEIEEFVSNLEALKRPFLTSALSISPGTSPKHGGGDSSAGSSDGSTGGNTVYNGFATGTISGSVFMIEPPAPVAATPQTGVPSTTSTGTVPTAVGNVPTASSPTQ
jgi:Tfp pilus assembly protein PilO